ncbi:MAG: hypothetical protein H7257_09150 [Taibaiella sp.]|nr:hypothetical protein [Taibaiella sp.]
MSTLTKNPGESKDEVKQPNAVEVNKSVENHKQAAAHHQEAAKHHLDAANHHESGHHDKAHTSAVLAHGHSSIASDHQKEDAKNHALGAKH